MDILNFWSLYHFLLWQNIYNICLIGHKQRKVQVKSSRSQNDRPIPQYVKISSIRILKGVASRGKTDFFFSPQEKEGKQSNLYQTSQNYLSTNYLQFTELWNNSYWIDLNQLIKGRVCNRHIFLYRWQSWKHEWNYRNFFLFT